VQPPETPPAHEAATDPVEGRAPADNEREVGRVLEICNACRYCEGYCAVFPAMTRRLSFGKADVHFLANLCHNCGACLYACQYAPPHEFGVNVPRAMASVRRDTYTEFAWPRALGALYRRNGITLSAALTASLAFFLVLAARSTGPLWRPVAEKFYSIFPHDLLVALFAPVFVFALVALAVGVLRFWRQEPAGPVSGAALGEATRNVLRLKYLDGGHGDGCNNEDDAFSNARRRFHHLTFYGFLLCFAATCVATLYHYLLGRPAPYPDASLPKLLGISGGLALIVGTIGLFWLNLRRHPLQQAPGQQAMDRGFTSLLLLAAVSGLALIAVRRTAALPVVLCLHLGAVMALFLTLPAGKFAHGVYRTAALLKWSIERRQPSKVRLTDE
jgi:citrate/tricarballylate utilization protein